MAVKSTPADLRGKEGQTHGIGTKKVATNFPLSSKAANVKPGKASPKVLLIFLLSIGSFFLGLYQLVWGLLPGYQSNGEADDLSLMPPVLVEPPSNSSESGQTVALPFIPGQLKAKDTPAEVPTTLPQQKDFEVCFVTAIYGNSASRTDRPCNAEKIVSKWPSDVRAHFFLYTNLEDLPAPGFTKVFKNFTSYRRFITQSRWGKFMAWKDPVVADHCETILYFDGMLGPSNNYTLVRELVHKVHTSPTRIVQTSQSFSISKEFKSILQWKKDLEVNVNASLVWLRGQPGFKDHIRIYKNTYFGYDPDSPSWQKVSNYFWQEYENEKGSWRDQPLWAYAMYRSKVSPTIWGEREFKMRFQRRGRMASHHYSAQDDNNANSSIGIVERLEASSKSLVESTNTSTSNRSIGHANTEKQYRICFVTAIYGSSVVDTDMPCNGTETISRWPISVRSSVKFFLYTNLLDLSAPGFEKVFKAMPYRRFITQSRWGKFMAWKDAKVRENCQTVVYFDGMLGPADNFTLVDDLVSMVRQAPSRIVQAPQSHSITKEFKSILQWRKDLEVNVNASLDWFQAQPDFKDNVRVYKNTYFGYDPESEDWQRVSSYFWGIYEREVGSWRDQPLWAYAMHHTKVSPRLLDDFQFKKRFPRKGKKASHHYSANDENNALSLTTPTSLQPDITNVSALPGWMTEYFSWHRKQMEYVHRNQSEWKRSNYLILRCYKQDEHCGGFADRLKPLPLFVLAAHKSRRVLLIHWTRPYGLEHFLAPRPLGFNWTVPMWLASAMKAPGVEKVYTRRGNRLLHTATNSPTKTVVMARMQDALGGLVEYDELEGPGEFTRVYHELFRTIFIPVDEVRDLVQSTMKRAGLIPGKFVVAHYRATYAKKKEYSPAENANGIAAKSINAVNCASSLVPGATVYFASDTTVATQAVTDYARQNNYSISTIEHKREPLHLDKAGEDNAPADYYSVFVDMLIMSEGVCTTFGQGGFGRYASLLSFNASCRDIHLKRKCPRWVSR